MNPNDVERIEVDLVLDAIARRYGYDFRNYARASLRRRLQHRLNECGGGHLSDLIPRLLHDPDCFAALLGDLSITVTEMFRDPPFFRAVREHVVPVLRTYPFVKIWHPGCATGEEVYSMKILLTEEGLGDRLLIYATDFNKGSLDKAREAIFPDERIELYAANYAQAGGKARLADYYTAGFGSVKLRRSLTENITFAHHNLVADGVFGEMNMIVCRNVLIYFDRVLQDRVLNLFLDSLCHRGFLCLGARETLEFSSVRDRFQPVTGKERIYRTLPTAPMERSA